MTELEVFRPLLKLAWDTLDKLDRSDGLLERKQSWASSNDLLFALAVCGERQRGEEAPQGGSTGQRAEQLTAQCQSTTPLVAHSSRKWRSMLRCLLPSRARYLNITEQMTLANLVENLSKNLLRTESTFGRGCNYIRCGHLQMQLCGSCAWWTKDY